MKLILFLSGLYLGAVGPYFNGSFYPANREELDKAISGYFSELKPTSYNDPIAALVPHAGYIFSAKVAAKAYISIPDAETYFIIAPSHRYWIENAVSCDENFNTPYGEVKTDKEIIEKLTQNNLFKKDCEKFINEHDVEIQLPFLQHRFKNRFKIVPLLINTTDTEKIKKIALHITNISKETSRKIFYIISSDLSHYPEYENAKIVDMTLIEAIKSMDIFYIDLTSKILLSKKINNYQTSACGLSAIMLGVEIAKQQLQNADFQLIKYSNSFEEQKSIADREKVVGYAAGFFIKSKGNKKKKELSNEEKKALIQMARKSIEDAFNGKDITFTLYENIKFNMPAAVFITLTQNSNLRGCMGTTQPTMSVADAVKYFARVSAFSDPRFSPLKKEELSKTKIEISVLSPLRKIKDHTEIKEKKDGVVVVSSGGSGLFLPQVWEYFNSKEEFLSELCSQKAGLDPSCWKNKDTQIFVFDVEKFSE